MAQPDDPNDAAPAQGHDANVPLWRKIVNHPLARLGPGLITGVADDDPSGIATYSHLIQS